MPLRILFLITCLSFMRVATAQDVLMPRPLRQGDRVAIVSPSSTPDSLVVEKGAEVLRQWGYEPVVGKHALSKYHGFAGTVEERVEDFLWALRDTTICAILCSRGGDGAVQLLPYISLEEFRRNPKWFLGFSDATALHSAWVSAGVMSLHCTMCEGIASRQENDSSLLALRGVLEGKMPSYQVPHHPLDQSGVGEGLLVGGNLSVLCGVAGSNYDCLQHLDKGLILFIEDTGEGISKVDRMLHQLDVRGILTRLKGIVVGHFSKYKAPENDFDDMYDMLHHYLQHLSIPVCYDFPSGHHSGANLPLVEGCSVRLTVDECGTTLQFVP